MLGANLSQLLIESRLLIGREHGEDLIAQRARTLGIARAAGGMRLRVVAEEVLGLLLLLRGEPDRCQALHPLVVRMLARVAQTLRGRRRGDRRRGNLCRDGNRQGECRDGRGHKQDFHGFMIPGRPAEVPEGRIRKAAPSAELPGEFQGARSPRDDLELRAAGILEKYRRICVEIRRALDAFCSEPFEQRFKLHQPADVRPKRDARQAGNVVASFDEADEKRGPVGLRLFVKLDCVVRMLGRRLVPLAVVVDVRKAFARQAELRHQFVVECLDGRERGDAAIDVIVTGERGHGAYAYGSIAIAFTASDACASNRLKFS